MQPSSKQHTTKIQNKIKIIAIHSHARELVINKNLEKKNLKFFFFSMNNLIILLLC